MSTNDERRTTNDELRATNDELRATNDELRATNDERRTTNDELRATNDEEEEASGRQVGLPGTEMADRRPPQEINARTQGREDARPASAPLTTDPLTTDLLNTDPLPPSLPPPHLYFPRPTAAEQRVLAATADAPDLQPEVELVRLVLRRLLAHLDESAGEMPPEETRRVAALLFSGARTVALLLGKRPPASADTEPWLAEALQEMKKIGKQG